MREDRGNLECHDFRRGPRSDGSLVGGTRGTGRAWKQCTGKYGPGGNVGGERVGIVDPECTLGGGVTQ